MRCSAERPRTSNSVRSLRARCTALSSWTRPSADWLPACRTTPVLHGRSRASPRSTTWSSNRASMVGPSTSSSSMPVQLLSLASSLRYSSASRPTIDALSRSGRSLVTTVTWRPSAAMLRATARMRWSLRLAAQRRREPRHLGVVHLDPQGAAGLVRRHRPQQRAVREAQVLEHPQRLAGRPAEVGVVTLALELGQHDERDHHLVLREARQRPRVGEQNRRVEYVDARVQGGIVQRNPHSCRDGHRSPVKREDPRRWWMRVPAHRSPTPRGGRWDRGRPA